MVLFFFFALNLKTAIKVGKKRLESRTVKSRQVKGTFGV